ncbi:MAG: CPBP family intramembrane metalloprotease [Lachnospiraceae bacterium]|nr:CPBP family intramembrane metalloprotease [Lachnospiraceae bacterium]
MSKIKEFIKDISPLNNRSEMPMLIYLIKVIIIFWFVKFGSEIICEGAVIGLHFACGKNPLQGEIFEGNVITLITYFGYALMVGIFFLYWKLFQKKTIAELGFTKKCGTYLIGMIIGAILVVVSVFSIIATGAITYNGKLDNIDYLYIFLMFGVFICQGMMEEVLCRGIVMQLLRNKTSIPIAVGVSTILFTIPHILNMTGESAVIIIFAIINLILISLIFSALTICTGSIWAACGFHSIWNFILYNILGLNLSGNDEMTAAIFDMKSVGSNILNGGVYGIEASVVTAAILAVVLIIIIVIYDRKGSVIDGI